MFFLSYVNETMYFLWNLPFFKMVPPKTSFFSFFKPWAYNSSTNQYSYQLFLWLADDTPHAILSQKCILWERGLGGTPSALRCLSYLTNSFLTGTKHSIRLKTSRGALFLSPPDVYVRSYVCLFYTLIKLYYTKTLRNQDLSLAPEWIPLLQRPRILVSFTAQQQHLISMIKSPDLAGGDHWRGREEMVSGSAKTKQIWYSFVRWSA